MICAAIAVATASLLVLVAALPARADYIFEMQSGKKIEILGEGPERSADGSTLTMRYRTVLADAAALRTEADEVFRHLVIDARREKAAKLGIVAQGPDGARSNSLFEVQKGTWRFVEPKERVAAGLDPEFVRALMARYDRAYETNMQPVILSYLANEWTLSQSDRPQMSRGAFLFNVLGVLDGVTDRAHRREITEIVIASGGASARVESREFDRGTHNGVTSEMTARATDIVELNGNAALVVRSSKQVEARRETRLAP